MDTIDSNFISKIISCGIRHEEMQEQDHDPFHLNIRFIAKWQR